MSLDSAASTKPNRSISLELIRKRTQEHDGLLSDLRDLDLHQNHLHNIGSVLGRTCPSLKRLYLHNNLLYQTLPTDFSRLKGLRVLVLALNNLSSIRGLEQLETLQYLDVSFNIIGLVGLKQSLGCLKRLTKLQDLFFLGNPCERNWKWYRMFYAANLPQLSRLDGTNIDIDERAIATHDLDRWNQDLLQSIALSPTPSSASHQAEREAMSEQWIAIQEKIDSDRRKSMMSSTPPRKHADVVEETRTQEFHGDRRNRNDDNYSLQIDYRTDRLVLTIEIPKEIPTEDMDIDIKSDYISLIIHAKVLRIRLPNQIRVEDSQALRSQATGKLELVLPYVNEIVVLDNYNDVNNSNSIKGTVTFKIGIELLNDATKLKSLLLSSVTDVMKIQTPNIVKSSTEYNADQNSDDEGIPPMY